MHRHSLDKNRSDRLCDIKIGIGCNSRNSLHGASLSCSRVWLWRERRHKRYTHCEFAGAHPHPSSRLNYTSTQAALRVSARVFISVSTDTRNKKNHSVLGVRGISLDFKLSLSKPCCVGYSSSLCFQNKQSNCRFPNCLNQAKIFYNLIKFLIFIENLVIGSHV